MTNDVSIPRECFHKISEFLKKIGRGQRVLVYNGIYNCKNLQKHKIYIFGTKTHLYELICHPHIEKDQTKPVCFMKKISLIKKIFINLKFNGKNHKSQINQNFLVQTDLFHKTDGLCLVLIFMWVTYELI